MPKDINMEATTANDVVYIHVTDLTEFFLADKEAILFVYSYDGVATTIVKGDIIKLELVEE